MRAVARIDFIEQALCRIPDSEVRRALANLSEVCLINPLLPRGGMGRRGLVMAAQHGNIFEALPLLLLPVFPAVCTVSLDAMVWLKPGRV